MALEVVGSIPLIHPKVSDHWDVAKPVRHQTLTLALVGSNPAIPAIYGPLAQLVEHLTFNQGVCSSTLQWLTKGKPLISRDRRFFVVQMKKQKLVKTNKDLS